MAEAPPTDSHASVRGSVSFVPNWYHVNGGLDYGERYYLDPRARIETDMRARRLVWEHFGDLGLGREHPEPDPTIDFGMCLLPAVYGCKIRFFPNNWPRAVPPNLGPDAAEGLTPPALPATEPMASLVQQMDWLEAEYGRVTGDLNTTGVLNLLLDLRGESLYLDMHDQPELAHHLVDVAVDSILDLSRFVRRRLGREHDLYMHPNCANVHVAASTYRVFLRPADERLARELQPFGIHQCCDASELLEAYAELRGVRYLDVQATTNLRFLAATFPDIPMTITLCPVMMRHATPTRIARSVREIARTLARPSGLEITAPALDAGTPARNVRAFMAALREVATAAWGVTTPPPSGGRGVP